MSPAHKYRLWTYYGLATGLCVLLNILSLQGQLLQKDWDEVYGGNGWEECNAVSATNDGGYVMAGYTATDANGDVTEATYDLFPNPDRGDGWVVKTDANGILQWQKRYGGDRQDRLWSINQTADGGYILGGWSRSNIGPLKSEACYGEHDYWIVKTDNVGNYLWDQTFGGDSLDYLQSLIQTSDGGFLIGGMSRSNAGPVKSEPRRGNFDLWVVKTDGNGILEWEKTIGGSEEERLNEMHELPDGSFVLGGSCESPIDGIDVNRPQIGGKDFWLINIDPTNGSTNWEERFGGTDEDEIQTFVPVSDGGFLLVGGSRSAAFPTGGKSQNSLAIDIWALKINAARQYEWDVTLGGNEFDNCYSAKENTVGHFILGGYSQSGLSGSKTSPNRGAVGSEDFWLNYLGPDGTPLWDHAFGGTDADVMENMFQTSDGGYILAGHSRSTISADKSKDTKGLNDFWIVKTGCNVNIDFNDTIVCPNTDVVLNATDLNCLACSWEWDDMTNDSLRTININGNTSYSVTLTDGVGCSRSADLDVDVFPILPLDLPTTISICDGDFETIGVPDVPSSSYSWSNLINTSTQLVGVEDVYTLTVTDNNACQTTDSVALIVNDAPIVNIGNDTTLCAGSPITLDAGNAGSNFSWTPAGNSQTLTLNPASPMIVEVTVTNPTTTCASSDMINITDVYALPAVANLQQTCNPDNLTYNLSFTVADPSQVVVQGLTGEWLGNTYVDTLDSGTNYNFYLENLQGCAMPAIQDFYSCACSSDAGEFASNEISVCGDEVYTAAIINHNLDGNDIQQLIVHDGDANTIGSIIETISGNTIVNNGLYNWDQQYYITIVVGNDDGSGAVDNTDGCLSISNGIPLIFRTPPNAEIIPLGALTLDCDHTFVILDGVTSSGTGLLDFNWTGPQQIVNPNDLMIEASDSGTYQLMVTDPYGCSAVNTVDVELEEGLPVLLLNGIAPIDCNSELITISALGSSQGGIYDWNWSGNGIQGLSSTQVDIVEPGTYMLAIQNTQTTCVVEESFIIGVDTLAPAFSISNNFYLDCEVNEAALSLTLPGCTSCEVDWSSADGGFIDLNDPQNPIVDNQGIYEFSILNTENGCINQGFTEVVQNPDGPQSFDYEVLNPDCAEQANGEVMVDNIVGGVEPFLYSLNGSESTSENQFSQLSPGTYSLMVIDNQGCTEEAEFTIDQAEEIVVELGDDITISLGDEVKLFPLSPATLEAYSWASEAAMDCLDCENPIVAPTEQTIVELEVTSDEGCVATDRVTIYVKQDVPYYIPNAFSPNGDGSNDFFRPFFNDKGVSAILSFQIYDRWGEFIYEEIPTDLSQLNGWDGRSNGKFMNPGVYIYKIHVLYKNQKDEIISGDVTLIR